jgi:hypothetical protein
LNDIPSGAMDFQRAALVTITHISYYAKGGELVSFGSPTVWLSELVGYREKVALSIKNLSKIIQE